MKKIFTLLFVISIGFANAQQTITLYILDGEDDAYQLWRGPAYPDPTGEMFLDSDGLYIGHSWEPATYYMTGLRYLSVPIPPESVIESAYVQFYSFEANDDTTGIRVYCERNPNPLPFSSTDYDISNRTTTYRDELWVASEWQAFIPGMNQRTHDMKDLVQEIVDMDGWEEDNDLVFLFKGTNPGFGEDYPKSACSWEFGGEFYAPYLEITFSPPASVDEANIAKAIDIFPNPVSDKFCISLEELREGDYTVSIFNLQGAKVHEVYSGLLRKGDHQFYVSVDEQKLESGIYLLSIHNSEADISRKIIVR